MAAPTASIARRPAVGQPLSESFAVVAHRKHTLAVRNGMKFRGVFLILGCEMLFSRPTFVTIRPTFGSMVRFWEITGRTMAQAWYEMAFSSTPGERSAKPRMVSCRPNGKPFMAKRHTFLTNHTRIRAAERAHEPFFHVHDEIIFDRMHLFLPL
jgi:hypothetical protein